MSECPQSVSGHGPTPDRNGCCLFCQKKISRVQPPPVRYRRSDLSDWYGYFYDPDWTGRADWEGIP